MASRTKLTDTATLELYRVALENAETQPEISAIMADLGYDSTVIPDGKALLTKTELHTMQTKPKTMKHLPLTPIFQVKRNNWRIYIQHSPQESKSCIP